MLCKMTGIWLNKKKFFTHDTEPQRVVPIVQFITMNKFWKFGHNAQQFK